MPAKKKKAKKKVPHRMVYEKKKIDLSYRSLEGIIPELQALMKEHGPEAIIEIYEEYGSCNAQLEWKRPENADEKKKRLDLAKRHKGYRKEQYERLKKEFE